MNVEPKPHWENIYSRKDVAQVSWYQPHAELSMQLIRDTHLAQDAAIIDVGGGASVLVDDLLHAGYRDITVLDIAAAALEKSQQRLGEQAKQVSWLVGNILETEFSPQGYDLWHDRAVFHFLTDAADRQRYMVQVKQAVKPGGFIIVATFAEDGPLKCSGLEVQRYSIAELRAAFAEVNVELLRSGKMVHVTPAGNEQRFSYCLFQRK